MKSVYKIGLIFICLLWLTKPVLAQRDTSFLTPTIDIETMLPPLDSLQDIAVLNNPWQGVEESNKIAAEWNLHYVRKLWTQGFRVFYKYTFGNLPLFAIPQQAAPGVYNYDIKYQGYQAGVELSLTVFDFLAQKGKTNQAKALIEAARYKKGVEALLVRQTVADFYTNMVGWQREWKARNEDMILQGIAVQIAEKDYKEGAILYHEYARQRNVYSIAIAANEEARKNFVNFYERLQTTLGVKLVTLKRK